MPPKVRWSRSRLFAGLGLIKRVHVGEILWPPHRQFRRAQIGTGNKGGKRESLAQIRDRFVPELRCVETAWNYRVALDTTLSLHERSQIAKAMLPKEINTAIVLHLHKIGRSKNPAEHGARNHLGAPELLIPMSGLATRIVNNALVRIHGRIRHFAFNGH